MAKKTVAITGASGVVGSRFMLDNPDFNFEVFTGDIKDFSQVSRFFAGSSANRVVHLAAIVPKQIVDKTPAEALAVNVGGTLNVLEAIRQKVNETGEEAPYLFYASTSHVYASAAGPLSEDSQIGSRTLYGLTKFQGEEWCRAYVRDFNLKIGIGRFFSFSDPKQTPHYFIPAMFKKIREAAPNSTLEISGVNGSRDFLSVQQVTRALRFFMDQKLEGVFNVGTGKAVPLLDIIKEISIILGRSDLEIKPKNDEATHLTADTTKLASKGFKLESEISQLLKSIVED